ncbi:hypothetical protein [Erwinia sp. PsM31]|uniref:hypothetical protein n=1 Tax=Erwinia sp. PsM31 TaxID=3030535 RepID=UPI00263AF573|nr:hypothetical protein [Erwinia sp. PsM31]MDN4628648.1 hypothetical protein [Erwinia sp. PsM31]
MNNKTFVRTLLVNSENKQFIKSLDERSLDSYIELLSKERQKENKNHLTIIDFSPVIEHFHQTIETAFRKHRSEEIKLHHATTYNNWLRLKDIPADKETIISDQSMKIMNDTEWTINAVIASTTSLRHKYFSKSEEEKKELCDSIIGDTDIFIESILCHIHAAIIFDTRVLKKSITIPQHLISIFENLQDLLRYEAGVHPDLTLAHANIIEQSYMENIGIDPELIINLTNANTSIEKIKQKIYSNPIQDVQNFGNNQYTRQWTLIWHKASTHKTERAIVIADKMKKILSIMNLINKIKNQEYEYSRDSIDVANVEMEIKLLTNKQ